MQLEINEKSIGKKYNINKKIIKSKLSNYLQEFYSNDLKKPHKLLKFNLEINNLICPLDISLQEVVLSVNNDSYICYFIIKLLTFIMPFLFLVCKNKISP
jgi:hypothetical protein